MWFVPLLLLPLSPPVLVQDVGSRAPETRISDIALLPDGNLLAGLSDGFIVVVDAETGKPWTKGRGRPNSLYPDDVFATHPAGVYALAVDPRGELVAAGSVEGRIALWRVKTGHGEADGYPGRYASPEAFLTPAPDAWGGRPDFAWTSTGSHLMTWSDVRRPDSPPRREVKLWNRAGELVWTGPRARAATVSPTADRLALLGEDEVWIGWPGQEGTRRRVEGATELAFSPDGKRLAIGGMGCHLRVLDVETAETLFDRALDVKDPFQDTKFAADMQWSPDGRWLAISLGKGVLPIVIDPTDGRLVWSGGFQGCRMDAVFPVAWTPDNRLVYGWDETFLVEPATGEQRVIARDERHRFVAVGDDALVFITRDGLERIDLATLRPVWSR